jgi:hypothetical protein
MALSRFSRRLSPAAFDVFGFAIIYPINFEWMMIADAGRHGTLFFS